MDWSKGYSAKYIVTKVDKGTWGDSGEIEITDGTIDRDATTSLLESASLKVTETVGEEWIRVYLIAKQDGETVREALFTGLSTTPSRSIIGRREENTLECYSVLKVADDILLPLGYYAAAGATGGQLIQRLLVDLPCKVTVRSGSPILVNNLVAGSNESKLSMARKIADAIDWQIRIDGKGNVFVEPKPKDIVANFNSLSFDILEPEVTDSQDLFSIPNVVRITMSGKTALAENDDEESAYSISGRGREIWKSESVSSLSDSESLAAYAMRRLKELQSPARTLSYKRRFHPNAVPNSLVSIIYPEQSISGTFRIESQSITLGANAQTQEDAIYES